MWILLKLKYQQLKQYDWANAKYSFWTIANILLFSMVLGFAIGRYILVPRFLN